MYMCTYNRLPYCLLSAAVSVEFTFDTSDLDALPSIMVSDEWFVVWPAFGRWWILLEMWKEKLLLWLMIWLTLLVSFLFVALYAILVRFTRGTMHWVPLMQPTSLLAWVEKLKPGRWWKVVMFDLYFQNHGLHEISNLNNMFLAR